MRSGRGSQHLKRDLCERSFLWFVQCKLGQWIEANEPQNIHIRRELVEGDERSFREKDTMMRAQCSL